MSSALDEVEYLESFAEEELYLNHASYGPPSRQVAATTQHLQNLARAASLIQEDRHSVWIVSSDTRSS